MSKKSVHALTERVWGRYCDEDQELRQEDSTPFVCVCVCACVCVCVTLTLSVQRGTVTSCAVAQHTEADVKTSSCPFHYNQIG